MLFNQAVLLALATLAVAHPGHEDEEYRQAVKARSENASKRRALEGCASSLEARGVNARAVERRKQAVHAQRKAKRVPVDAPFTSGLAKRNTTTILNTDHEGSLNGTTALGDEDYVFNSTTCTVLNPEGEVGPYYVLGEYVRSDLVVDQEGVDGITFWTDIQFINVNTCEPLADVWADIWSCNATGVYGGVESSGNGNSNDATNLDNTALRGIQQADADGVVQFKSIVPGHYSGRANHMHVVVHENATKLENGTLSGGSVPHIGQLFWDQSLLTKVEATSPYNTNNITWTLNSEDRIFGEQETEDTTSDPVFDYVYLSDDIEDGLFGWMVIGIDPSASYTPSYSFELTSSGGIAASGGDSTSTGGGGGDGGDGGDGGFPGSS